jgi:hypothetical protein
MEQITSDVKKSKRPFFLYHAIQEYLRWLTGDQVQNDIRNWLSPPNPWKSHSINRESYHNGTAIWFVEGNTFAEWKSSGPSSLLWIHGKRQYLQLQILAESDLRVGSWSWKERSLVR